MIWQDALIAVCQFSFIMALCPMLLSEQKPPRFACVMTAIPLVLIAIALATLKLWWGASCTAMCALMWWALAMQRRI